MCCHRLCPSLLSYWDIQRCPIAQGTPPGRVSVGRGGQGEGERGRGFLWRSEGALQPHHLPLIPLHIHCRWLLTKEQKRLYTKVAQYCNRSTDLIPMSFVLGMGPSPELGSWVPLLAPALAA